MSKPFDATTKHLLEADPNGWLALFGFPTTAHAEVIDSDLSTVTSDVDKVIRVDEPLPWLAHVEFQSSRELWLELRVARYNVMLEYKLRLPVQSILVLLRPEADGGEFTGLLRRSLPNGRCYDEFHYQVVRVWELPVESLLAGGLATLPLAPLADIGPDQLPAVIGRMKERITGEAPLDEAKVLWTAAYVLMGLRYSAELTNQLFRGVVTMKDSATYQAILEEGKMEGFVLGRTTGKEEGLREGKVEGKLEGKLEGKMEGKLEGKLEGLLQGQLKEAKAILLRLGAKQFGAATPRELAQIDSFSDLSKVEELTDRLLDASSWSELLAAP